MPAPHRLSRTFQDALGTESADIMVDWMNQSDTQHASTQQEIAAFRSEVRSEFTQLRQEMRTEIAQLRQEMHTNIAELRQEMRTGYVELSRKIDVSYANLQASFTKSHADFMKWTLGFWVISLATVVGAVVGLSRVGR